MGISLKGVRVKGLSIKGGEILTPAQVTSAPLLSWHQWKTGITTVTGVSQWDDQSGNGFHLVQGTTTRQPAYNPTTGKITPDGTDDYLMATVAFISNPSSEYTFVIEESTNPAIPYVLSRMRHGTTADGDCVIFSEYTNSTARKQVQGGTGQVVQAQALPPITSGKFIVSFMPGTILFNGSQGTYAIQSSGGWADTATPPYREGLFALLRNSGGVFAQPSAYGSAPVYEWCHHNGILSSLDRIKMINYLKIKHGII
jgi:hypothetical protein